MERAKHTIDAQGKIAGRLATQIAIWLQGKHKASYNPRIDGGDFVIVTNVKDMKFSGKKLAAKVYHSFSGYPGGIRNIKLDVLMAKNPAKALEQIVINMLPNNRLRKARLKRLTIS